MDASLILQLWASVLTICATYSYSNRWVLAGSLFGLVSQIGWWGIMAVDSLWGLFPINVMMVAIHSRALWKETRIWRIKTLRRSTRGLLRAWRHWTHS